MSMRSISALVGLAIVGFIGIGAAAVLVSDGDRRIGAIEGTTNTGSFWTLELAGQPVGRLASVDSCGPRRALTLTSQKTGLQTSRKTWVPGRLEYSTCALRFGLSLDASLYNWIKQMLSGQAAPRNLTLVAWGADEHQQFALQLQNSLIKEVVFPKVGGGASPYLISLTVQPETVVRQAQYGGHAPPAGPVVTDGAYEVRFDGQLLQPTQAFGPVTVKQELQSTLVSVGGREDEQKTVYSPGDLVLETTSVTTGRAANSPLETWFASYGIQGQNASSNLKNASFEIVGARNFVLSFSQVGIFDAQDTADLERRTYSLYFGGLTMNVIVPPPPTPNLTDSDPDSPANDNNPEIKGTAEAGSTVRLYRTSDCSGTPEATGSAADFASPGLTASLLKDNTTRTFRATASNADRTSPCSTSSLTYVESTPTPAEPPAEPPASQPPAAPENVTAQLSSQEEALVQWAAVDGVEKYVVLMALAPGGEYDQVWEGEETSVAIPVSGGPPYYFVVRSVVGGVESENSAVASVSAG